MTICRSRASATWASKTVDEAEIELLPDQGNERSMHIQLVTFRLKPDTSRETFLELTSHMLDWLRQQPGFVAYELYEGADGWCDRISWNCEKDAREALNTFISTPLACQMIPLVQDGYTSFFGEAVIAS